ncbi:FAD-NAD(P)-binding [Brevibacterium sp. Mu109]|uniref:FAD/NAD(P)-binding protein n=1 Tax=Brevibacterium sp. Mu109 TaxID=1255669 RepID=UPI000C422406|nr:FAD/NAD(P)-binding protein [Brevibacterium sp. Mu109]SMX65494.1 FAD-NAD(P)-binding [Brevibacterium sp. Mu109]
MTAPLRVGIIGAGPRGLTVLERLVAHTVDAGAPVHIRVVDPFPPGAGRVWRTDQSPHLLMNTVLEEQTVFPDATCDVAHSGTGPTMAEWADSAPPAGRFPQRRDYGRYLAWSWEQITASAPDHVEIVHEPVEVTTILDAPSDAQTLWLSDGRSVDVDAVVLCVGHIPAALSDERGQWQRFARDAGLSYLPPGLPAETPVDALPPGEPVLIRGFGLNFFDLQSLLTHGRGGTFRSDPERGPLALTYTPSGDEPILIPGSRRGVPYRSKPISPDHPLPADPHDPTQRLRFFTPQTIARLPVHGDGLRFDAQLWPLILADLRSAWYSTLARTRPDAFAEDPSKLLGALSTGVERLVQAGAAHESERWHIREERVLRGEIIAAEPHFVFDMRRLLRPLGDESFPDRESLRAALMEFLRTDLEESLIGPAHSPLKALFPVLWQARALLKDLVVDDRLSPASFTREVRGWFEDFVSGLCDGPPPQRYAELIALADAGLVDFAGPQVRVTTSGAGEPATFIATSPAVPVSLRAPALIDASSPANRVQQADDSLIRSMLDRGQLCAATHDLDDGTRVPSSGLAVTGTPYRTVDARSRVHPHRYCLSLQLSSVQLGLAIAANPRTDAQTLRDADAVARAVLGLG